jgi:hypothetical protein
VGPLIEIVLGVTSLIGVGALLLWLLGLPADEDEDELAGLISGNWQRLDRWIDPGR